MQNHIALLSPNMEIGGAERIMVNLIHEFISRGFYVDLLLMKNYGKLLTEIPNSVKVIDLASNKPRNMIFPLLKYLRTHSPTVLLSAHSSINWAACLAVRLSHSATRCVVREESTLSSVLARTGWMTRIFRPWFLRIFCRPYQHITVSKGAADDYIDIVGVPNTNVTVIYNPVINQELLKKLPKSVSHPWFGSSSTPTILAVGRLHSAKGFDILLEAFALLLPHCHARLIILGEGPERANLEAKRDQLKLGKYVDMPGFVANPLPYMKAADIFTLSSRWEGLANVLVEALVCGATIVATDCPHGPSEILSNGHFGILTPPNDSLALANALHTALKGKITLAQPTEEWLEQFSITTATDSHLRLMGLPTRNPGTRALIMDSQ